MAPRQTARRLLVAAPALALTALAVTACSPPNEQPADADAPYTLPTYSEEPKAESHGTSTEESSPAETTTGEETTDPAGTAGAPEAPAAPAPGEGEQPAPALPGAEPAQP